MKKKSLLIDLIFTAFFAIASISLVMVFSSAHYFPLSGVLFILVSLIYWKNKTVFHSIINCAFRDVPTAVCSIIISLLIGTVLNLSGNVDGAFDCIFSASLMSRCLFLFKIIGISCIALFLIAFVLKCSENSGMESKAFKIKKPFVYAIVAVTMLAYYFLIYFPGIITPDNCVQFYMCTGELSLNNDHPLLHTALIKLLVFIIGKGSYVYYFLFQIIVSSLIIGYSLCWVGEKFKNKTVFICCLLFYLVFPYFGATLSSMTKDYFFGVFVLFFTIQIADAVITEGKSLKTLKGILLLAVSGIGVVFLRSNGILIVAVMSLLAPLFVKKVRVRFFAINAAVIFIYLSFVSFVVPSLGIDKGKKTEALGIPLNQICRVVADNGNYDEEKEYINSILSIDEIKKSYDAASVDSIKFNENFNIDVINDDIGGFFSVWFKLLIKNPGSYFKAYFSNTEMLWNPLYESGVIEDNHLSPVFNNEPRPLLGRLAELYKQIHEILQYSDYTAFLHVLWNPACYLILSFIIVPVLKEKSKNFKSVWIFLPIWILWISLMLATPVAYAGRYLSSIFFCMPIFIAIAFGVKSQGAIKNESVDNHPGV